MPDVPVAAGAVTALGTIDLTSAEGPYAQILNLSIADHPRYGHVLEGEVAGVIPTHATLVYRWLRDGEVIAGATSSTYRVGLEDVLHELSVIVTARAPGYAETSAMATPLSTVPAVPTELALTASAARQVFGTTTPVTVTAAIVAPAGVPRTGEVELFVDGAVVARERAVDGVTRHVLSPHLAVGEHSVAARFRPDDATGRVLGSEAGPLGVVVASAALAPVAPMASSVSLTRSKARQPFGARGTGRVRLTARIVGADGSMPPGTVVFRSGGTTLGSARASGGRATLHLGRTQAVGRYQVVAEFRSSSPAVAGATSSAVPVRVVKAAAKVSGRLRTKRIMVGERARYRVRVTVPGVARPTGRLVIRDGKNRIGVVKLKAKHQGRRTVRLPRLAKGKHRIRVVYQGNASIKKKASRRVTLRVR